MASNKFKFTALAVLAIFFVVVFAIFFIKSTKSSQRPILAKEIYLDDVKNEIESLIVNHFDRDQADITYLYCNNANDCTPDKMEQQVLGNYGSTTWKIEFYTSLYASTEDTALKNKALERALDLTDQYLSYSGDTYTTQSFVFANAYKRTGDIKFLRAFVISTQSLVLNSITGSLFKDKWIEKAHPMNSVRYSEQPLLFLNIISSLSKQSLIELQDSLDDKEPWLASFHKAKFNTIINDYRELLNTKSKEATIRILESAKLASNQPRFQPIEDTAFRDTACWLAMGYASAWESSNDNQFKDKAYQTLKEIGMENGISDGKNIYLIQSTLPCVRTYEILSKDDSNMAAVHKKSIHTLISRFWDATKAPICSGAGGVILFAPFSINFTSSIPEDLCKSSRYSLADNAWMFSTINKLENFKLYPQFD